METQVCQYDSPTMVDRAIKVERDEDENSDSDVPCVSTVPIPADKNTGSYYYPSQAVVSPRTPVYTTVGKMAQKRKTIQALAHVSFEEKCSPTPADLTVHKRPGTSHRIEIDFAIFDHLYLLFSFVRLVET